jgi:Predicted membrane protein
MFIIILILLTALAAVAVFLMWYLGALVESKTYKSYYYEDLPEDFDFEKFKKNRQVTYAITGTVTAILSAVIVYMISDQWTFLRTLYVWACIVGGWWYGSNDTPFRNKPEAPPTMIKRETANGMGTLLMRFNRPMKLVHLSWHTL